MGLGRPLKLTKEEQRDIVNHINNGKTYREVAEMYNCSTTIIVKIFKKSGNLKPKNYAISKPRHSAEEQRQAVLDAIENGESLADVAKKYDVTSTTVSNWFQREGFLHANARSLKSSCYDDAVERVRKGESCYSVARALSISASTIHRLCEKNNVVPQESSNTNFYPAHLREEIVEKMKNGGVGAEIAKEYHVSTTMVSNWSLSSGVQRKKKQGMRYRVKKAKIVEAVRNGMSYGEAAKLENVTANTAQVWCKEEGVFSVYSRK
jgi:transposase-like protein